MVRAGADLALGLVGREVGQAGVGDGMAGDLVALGLQRLDVIPVEVAVGADHAAVHEEGRLHAVAGQQGPGHRLAGRGVVELQGHHRLAGFDRPGSRATARSAGDE
jgi:hypothetical protein